MKLFVLIGSLISARKRSAVLTVISVFVITVLFNYFSVASYDYITTRDYLVRGDYENKMAVVRISSNSPITDEEINKLLAPAGFENSWAYGLSETAGLLKANAPVSGKEEYDEYMYLSNNYNPFAENTQEELTADHLLIEYSREFSELIETSYTGELPSVDKDYGGRIPVIAAFNSPYEIGDTADYNFKGTPISVIVTAKYTDDNLSYFADANQMSGLSANRPWLFADREVMYKYKAETRPEEQEVFVKPDDWEDFGPYYKRQIFVTAENMPFVEFFDRVTEIDKNSNDVYSLNEVGAAIPSVFSLDSKNELIICSLPLFVIIFLLGSIGAAANGFLNLDSRRKSLAVLKLCGMKRRTLIPLTFVCETVVTMVGAAAALCFSAMISAVSPLELISPLSAAISSIYIIALSLVMAAVQIISVERDDCLEVIRRYESI